MSKFLTWLGLGITFVYVLVVLFLVGDRICQLQTMDLNEVGDFLAGVFGPLAILWLILGFFQQGQELKVSNAALQMQAKELNESVQQQVKLVEIAQKQLAAEQEGFQHTRALYESTQIPDLRMDSMGFGADSSIDGNGQIFYFEFDLINFGGATAYQVEGIYTFKGITKPLFSAKDISKKGKYRHKEVLPRRPKSGVATFKFIYSYGDGVSGQKIIEVNIVDGFPMYPTVEIINDITS